MTEKFDIFVSFEEYDASPALGTMVDQLQQKHVHRLNGEGFVFRLAADEAAILKTFGGKDYNPPRYYPLS
jgi:hypothetical protein